MYAPARARLLSLVSALLLITTALLVAGCGDSKDESSKSAAGDSWKIGLQAPITGDLAQLGEGMLKGAQLAAAEVNEAGGVLGKDIEIIAIDDKGEPKAGVAAAKSAIGDGLDGVVGPYNSGVGIETLPLFIDDGLTPIRLTSNDTTNGMGYTLQPMTFQIAPVAATAMSKWLKAENVAIIFDETEAFTKGQAKDVREQLEKQDVKVVAEEGIEPGKTSYEDVVTEAGKSNADVIYLVTYFPEGGALAKEIAKQKLTAKCLADYGAYDTGFIKAAGAAAAAACPVVGVPAPGDFENADEHEDAFEDTFKSEPGTWSPFTYDSVKFLVDGVKKAGSFDSAKLAPVLDAVKGWTGWTGSVTIDPKTGARDPGTVAVTRTDDDDGFTVDLDWARAVGAPYSD